MPDAWTLPRSQRAQFATGAGVLAAILVLFGAAIAFFVAFASPAYVEPTGLVYAGRIDKYVVDEPVFFAEGKFWLIRQPDDSFLALYAKDPNRGCTVPWRPTFSFRDPATDQERKGWFRNPCHGQTYDIEGRCVFGPCARGLDRYETKVTGSHISVNTRRLIKGPPRSACC